MPRIKRSGASMGKDQKEQTNPKCTQYYAQERLSLSVPRAPGDIMDLSRRLSYYNPTINLERRLHGQDSSKIEEVISRCDSTISSLSIETATSQSVPDLVNEIASLEVEVELLERHLLSLYRSAFSQYLCRCSQQLTPHLSEEAAANPDQSVHPSSSSDSCCSNDTSKSEQRCKSQSLAEYLEPSTITNIDPCKLSQEIIRCISSIYCKLAKPKKEEPNPAPLVSSPTESVSSSSTFSPKDYCSYDNWSRFEDSSSPESQIESSNEMNGPYSGMLIIPELHVDSDRFSFASKMLENFRSLIKWLENIDPRKMEQEEQLAFWINIHNALVMHAFLAYGLHDNHMKRAYFIFKASYNIGGKTINAHLIQNSILGCRSHRPSPWIFGLLSPKKRLMMGINKKNHPYTVDRSEPLSHFALCTGAFSGPAVRVYTGKGVYEELEVAKAEFIQASVTIRKHKIVVPNVVQYYAKDASFELSETVEMVCKCMPETRRKLMDQCLRKRKLDKCLVWSRFRSDFRYLVHRDLVGS